LLVLAQSLNPFATAFRYPDDLMMLTPTHDDFVEAITDAENVYNFVLTKLPIQTHP
jgi:hypothetical protein